MAGEGFKHVVGIAGDRGQLCLRMLCKEGGEESWKQVLADGLRGRNGERTGGIAGGGGDGFQSLIGEGGELLRIGQKGAASGGEGDFTGGAVEESCAKLGFKGFDLLRDGGLGEQELFGREAEVEMLGGSAEDAEAEVLHAVIGA